MNTKLLSKDAMDIIAQYKEFRIGNAICSIPYFNNRRGSKRAALRVNVGKGSPKEIFSEIEHILILNKINSKEIDSEDLKKILVDNDIGIDCSGYAYYILNEESKNKGKGTIDKHLAFPFAGGFLGKIKSKIRPIENTDVRTFAHNDNSISIHTKDIQVGDIITMTNSNDVSGKERDHVLIIYQIEYQNFIPTILHYTHSIAWPTDGEYGHGIHEGKIEIVDINKNIVEQRWIENDKQGEENYTHTRAKKSTTEVRRLSWFI